MGLQFGVGSLTYGAETLARLHNINLTISYDTAMLRGGTLLFPTHLSHFNGNVEGHVDFGEVFITGLASIIGATGSAIAPDEVFMLSATDSPTSFSIVFIVATDGLTGTLTLPNVKSHNLTLNFSREDYTIPGFDFIAYQSGSDEVMQLAQ